jgi:hypothetical protein
MGISPPATAFPTLPPALAPGTFTLFDDFLYSTGGADPLEISGVSGALAYTNSAGVDADHPGVIEFDLTASGTFGFTYMSDTALQFLSLNAWNVLAIEWLWFMTGLGAATNFSVAMGFNSGLNGCTALPNQTTIGFTNNNAICTNFPLSNQLSAMSGRGGVFSYVSIGAIAPLFGTWVKSKIVWTKATQLMTFFTNDVQQTTIGIANIQDSFAAGAKGLFGVNSICGVAPGAGNFFRIDYISIAGVLSR